MEAGDICNVADVGGTSLPSPRRCRRNKTGEGRVTRDDRRIRVSRAEWRFTTNVCRLRIVHARSRRLPRSNRKRKCNRHAAARPSRAPTVALLSSLSRIFRRHVHRKWLSRWWSAVLVNFYFRFRFATSQVVFRRVTWSGSWSAIARHKWQHEAFSEDKWIPRSVQATTFDQCTGQFGQWKRGLAVREWTPATERGKHRRSVHLFDDIDIITTSEQMRATERSAFAQSVQQQHQQHGCSRVRLQHLEQQCQARTAHSSLETLVT